MIFDYDKFKTQLGFSESSDSYDPPFNGIAYGRYQFTIPTINRISKELGIDPPSVYEFINNHALQDQFYEKYVSDILNYISVNGLDVYLGNFIKGRGNQISTNINLYGLVAGAWLGGEGGLSNFLLHDIDKSDGHTFISDYISKFSELNKILV